MSKVATWIKADGTRQIVKSRGRSFSETEIQKYVGGYFEELSLPDGHTLLMNDDARRLGLPVNEEVSRDYEIIIRGDVLHLPSSSLS